MDLCWVVSICKIIIFALLSILGVNFSFYVHIASVLSDDINTCEKVDNFMGQENL